MCKNAFNVENKLEVALVCGYFKTGEIPKDFRLKGETKNDIKRRRLLILNKINKYPNETASFKDVCTKKGINCVKEEENENDRKRRK